MTDHSSQKEILSEMDQIKQELKVLNSHKLLTMYDSKLQLYTFLFLRGVLIGFGTVVGATIVVSIFIYLLSQIAFIPIIGEWVKAIIAEIQINPN
ncbi:MAG: hypothetical protein HQM14_00640 [SAR324 cluster bacterium]|nr:hypothetical protein [SAR324 cluster bacterium]